jgi:primosomal protein N' (replication factor Y) (superfamily II helicase)
MTTYLEIAVNVPKVAGVYHYHLPAELEGRVQPGHLVVVPFGRQRVQGLVLRQVQDPAVAVTRPVEALLDEQPVITPAMLGLAQELAQATLAPLAACVDLMLPPGLSQQSETLYSLRSRPDGDLGALSPTQKRLVNLLQKRGALRTRQLERALPRQTWQNAAQKLVRSGWISTQIVLPEPTTRPKTVRTAQLACAPDQVRCQMDSLGGVVHVARLAANPRQVAEQSAQLGRPGSKALERRLAVLQVLQENTIQGQPQPVEAGVLYAQTGAGLADLQKLHELGLVVLEEQVSPSTRRRQAMLQALLQTGGSLDVSILYAESGGGLVDLRYLEQRGLISLGENEIWRNPLAQYDYQPVDAPRLTHDQQAVWEKILAWLEATARGGPRQPVLLHGVTGSGKTEIYLRAVEAALQMGRQAIVLVPEIALTPQTVRRFQGRFPGQVGLWHSGLSQGERFDAWRRARDGRLAVMVGPRSALFTPFPRLGLIVVDECHDDSYYQSDPQPRYHAREAALAYARHAGALCLLGSATPDLVSTYRASQGQYQYLRLPTRILAHRQTVQAQMNRIAARARHPEAEGRGTTLPVSHYHPLENEAESIDLPPTTIVDMRQELKEGNRSIFSRRLQAALQTTLEQGQQAILFLNRRGTATYVFCRDCGQALKCPHCDIPLTYHGPQQALICHRCGYRRKMPQTCPACSGQRIRQYGTGTAKVEAEIQALFPQAGILRWDYETTRQKGSHEQILSQFAAHRADILVGTQMLAKGLDLPLVTLVGAVLADVGLNLPDYRAAERTFQVLTQVAGRAGRSPLGGEVILQTFEPEHYAIQAASRHDYRAFYQQELKYRRQLGYPPFAHLARLEFRHQDANQAERAARSMAARVQTWLQQEARRATELIGPVPCYFARLAGAYRWQIVLRGPDPASLLRDKPLENWRVEIDPVSLL